MWVCTISLELVEFQTQGTASIQGMPQLESNNPAGLDKNLKQVRALSPQILFWTMKFWS